MQTRMKADSRMTTWVPLVSQQRHQALGEAVGKIDGERDGDHAGQHPATQQHQFREVRGLGALAAQADGHGDRARSHRQRHGQGIKGFRNGSHARGIGVRGSVGVSALSSFQPKAVTISPPPIRTTGRLMPKNSSTCEPMNIEPRSSRTLFSATLAPSALRCPAVQNSVRPRNSGALPIGLTMGKSPA